jgi:hypothetical protein
MARAKPALEHGWFNRRDFGLSRAQHLREGVGGAHTAGL